METSKKEATKPFAEKADEQNPCHINSIRRKEIYATVEDEAFLVKLHNGISGKKSIVTLEVNQEEANIKVILYAQFAITLDIIVP